MKAVLDVLAAVEPIEWARFVGGTDPLRPPYVAWRFTRDDGEVETRIVDAVRAWRGPTEWTIHKGRRNWVIEPTKLARYAARFRLDVEAARQFGIEFPGETCTALEDARSLAEHLRTKLLKE